MSFSPLTPSETQPPLETKLFISYVFFVGIFANSEKEREREIERKRDREIA